MQERKIYSNPVLKNPWYFNLWDGVVLILVFIAILLLAWVIKHINAPYQLGDQIAINLAPSNLFYYSLRTVLRMMIAMFFSFIVAIIIGGFAAKSRRAEIIIIPLVDILQSVPVLGFLSISVVAFVKLFPGSMLGPESAAIFAIFTSQVWNMILSFYQSVKIIPKSMTEVAAVFHLSPWYNFWRIEFPFALPGLLWNTMISMSAGWFFVVASEAIAVANQSISLPGIGSYIAKAVESADSWSVVYAVLTMLLVILIYDQLLFRPLLYYANKFRASDKEGSRPDKSLIVMLYHRTSFVRSILMYFGDYLDVINFQISKFSQSFSISYKKSPEQIRLESTNKSKIYTYTLIFIGITAVVVLLYMLNLWFGWQEIIYVSKLGWFTALRIFVLTALSALIWVPVGVWIGLKPRFASYVQPLIQFLAAFPANLLFPVFVIFMVKFKLNADVWSSPLLILGTQWYILFNVISGVLSLPKEYLEVAASFKVYGWMWWRRFILPAVAPTLVVGMMTAVGGAWNASILAEALNWGEHKIYAKGLGAYITLHATSGDFLHLSLGIMVMCAYVLIINRFIWQPLYNLVTEKYQMG